MESLIKKTDLLKSDYQRNNPLIRTPKGFIQIFDRWRENEEERNHTELSRSKCFNLFKEALPFLSLDIKTKRKKEEISLKIKETNLKIR